MKRNFDMSCVELAMRVLERVRIASVKPDFVMADVVRTIMADYGCSENCAFRHARTAVDVLGIYYDGSQVKKAKKERRRSAAAYAGQVEAKRRGWPNGKPGKASSLDGSRIPAEHPWRSPREIAA